MAIWLSSGRSIGVSTPVTLDDCRERWPRELAGGWIVHVAKLGPTVVGFLAIKGNKVEQLFVTPEHQCRGIGKKLLDFAKTRMPDGFYLTSPVIGRGSKFYEREGLERGETYMHRFGFEMVRYDWRPSLQP
jgi:putative acetyltransferase